MALPLHSFPPSQHPPPSSPRLSLLTPRPLFTAAAVTKRVPPAVRADILRGFADGTYSVLCCTDILARGIDASAEQVVQLDFATDVTSFLHRAGRTARAQAPGKSVAPLAPSRPVAGHHPPLPCRWPPSPPTPGLPQLGLAGSLPVARACAG